MPTLEIEQGAAGSPHALLLRTRYEDRFAARAAGGRWSKERGAWRFPLGADLLRIAQTVPHVICTPSCTAHLQAEQERYAALRDIAALPDADVGEFGRDLDPHQRVAVLYLNTAGRALLADDMGLGKTPTSIRACERVGASRIIVVAVKSLHYNWLWEIGRWGVGTAEIVPTAAAVLPDARWLVTTYEGVVAHRDLLCQLPSAGLALIVDEAIKIKNPKALRTEAIWAAADHAEHVYLLSGAPVNNNLAELWSLLRTVDEPHHLSRWQWLETWFHPDMIGGWDVRQVHLRDPERFQTYLGGFFIRRTKELLNLPPKSREFVRLQLGAEQKRIYRELAVYGMAKLDALGSDGATRWVIAAEVIALIMRLRQVACTPVLIGGADVWAAKTEVFSDIVEDYHADHKVVAFTTFRKYAEILHNRAERKGAAPALITGEMSDKRRWDEVRRFSDDPACRVLVGTFGAAGMGLNLQAADICVIADHDWVPNVNVQAEDRLHRRGQDKPVHVIVLQAANTVDDYIEEVLARKEDQISEGLMVETALRGLRRDFQEVSEVG